MGRHDVERNCIRGGGRSLRTGRGTGGEIGDEAASIIELAGVIKWFDLSKGYGFIVPDSGMPDILLHVPTIGFNLLYVLVIARRTSRACLKNTATALAGIIAGRGHSKQRDIHSIPSRAQARHLALPTRRPLCQLHHLGRHPQAVPRLNGGAATS